MELAAPPSGRADGSYFLCGRSAAQTEAEETEAGETAWEASSET